MPTLKKSYSPSALHDDVAQVIKGGVIGLLLGVCGNAVGMFGKAKEIRRNTNIWKRKT